MIRAAATGAVLTLALLAGCGGGTSGQEVGPAEGPAATADASDTTGPVEGEPSDEPSDEPTQDAPVASFKEKLTYKDGLQVEVTKIRNGRFTASEVEYSNESKKGDPYTVFTVRVRNGSPKTIQLLGSASVTYGPDGDEAKSSYDLEDLGSMDGKLIKGKARSASFAFLIPPKYYGDVVMEFSTDFDHDSAVFSGSIK